MLHVILSYTLSVLSIPFLINSTNLGALIPTLARYFNIDYYFYQTEPAALCLGVVTYYTYVFLGFLTDVLQQRYQSHDIFRKLLLGSNQLQKLFPPFAISSILLYTNTTRFDTLRNSFIMFQTFLLILLPITHLRSKPFASSLCKSLYRSVLLWSLLYALFPRETHYYLSELTELFNISLGLDAYGYTQRSKHFSSPYNDYRYSKQSNCQQWMLY